MPEMGNPFAKPPSPSLAPREGLNVEAAAPTSYVVRGTLDDMPAYETRRAELREHVRKYADKLHARLLEIYKKYGATDAAGMLANAEARKGPRLRKNDVLEASKLLGALEYALDNNELSPAMALEAENDWIREGERERLLEFFGTPFEVPPIPEGITKEMLDFWKENGFELRYWPRVRLEERRYPGRPHVPGRRNNPQGLGIEFHGELDKIKNLPENLANPNLAGLEPDELPGRWMLADSRPKPNYASGKQAYENDWFVQGVLKSLPPGVLNPEVSDCLRNNIGPSVFSKQEFWDAFRTALKLDGVPGAAVRLPRAVEANAMGQGPGWHDTDTYEWCEEMYGPDRRLMSGGSGSGGASYLDWFDVPLVSVGFRPLAVFPV